MSMDRAESSRTTTLNKIGYHSYTRGSKGTDGQGESDSPRGGERKFLLLILL
jgi:hypothetical protein